MANSSENAAGETPCTPHAAILCLYEVIGENRSSSILRSCQSELFKSRSWLHYDEGMMYFFAITNLILVL